ncbi:MAG TPA: 2-isopropylmalate synthase [Gaiellaceae bacterium]|nr:2-isopropylmalate synthase [Gaiellaceae bacterium]
MSRRIQIFDTTLRDGEQSPGIALQPHEKAEIAEQLERLGVDVVEAGFPGASPGDFAGVSAVAGAVERPVVAALARTRREDLDAAAEALAGARRSRIHVFIATSPVHMEHKLGLEPREVLEQARDAVAYAAGRVDEVEFSCEDATRSEPEFVARVCRAAVRAGASVVNLPDTVGYAVPAEYAAFLDEVRRRAPELRHVTLSVHCHNDLGLAVANSLAGLQAGATQVECTVNGIGERAGNAALEEIVVALRVRGDRFDAETGVNCAEIAAASRLVSERTGYVVQPNKAVVGANAFAHEAGIHQDGMLKDERTYQIIDPAEVGVRMTLPLGKHSGRHAFARACAELGVAVSGKELDAAFRRFKERADAGGAVAVEDIFQEVLA